MRKPTTPSSHQRGMDARRLGSLEVVPLSPGPLQDPDRTPRLQPERDRRRPVRAPAHRARPADQQAGVRRKARADRHDGDGPARARSGRCPAEDCRPGRPDHAGCTAHRGESPGPAAMEPARVTGTIDSGLGRAPVPDLRPRATGDRPRDGQDQHADPAHQEHHQQRGRQIQGQGDRDQPAPSRAVRPAPASAPRDAGIARLAGIDRTWIDMAESLARSAEVNRTAPALRGRSGATTPGSRPASIQPVVDWTHQPGA